MILLAKKPMKLWNVNFFLFFGRGGGGGGGGGGGSVGEGDVNVDNIVKIS